MQIRWSMIKCFAFGVCFFALFFGMATHSRAESKEEGMYFSIIGVENSIGGDFNGVKNYENEELNLISYTTEIEPDQGFGLAIGGYNQKIAGEISYLRSVHDTSIPFDGDVELLNIDLKLYMLKLLKQNIKTYFLTGIVIPKITVENAGTDGTNLGDAIYRGFGLNLGLGTEIRIHNIGIDGSVVFRGMRINRIDVLGTELEPKDNFYANGRSYIIKLNYYF